MGQLGPIFEQTWVYLRLFEAILGNLEAILETSSKKTLAEAPRSFGQSDFLSSSSPSWNPKPSFFINMGMSSWTIFWSLFGSLLGTILGPIFGPELQRPKKLHFQKSGFRVGLSAFFRS